MYKRGSLLVSETQRFNLGGKKFNLLNKPYKLYPKERRSKSKLNSIILLKTTKKVTNQ